MTNFQLFAFSLFLVTLVSYNQNQDMLHACFIIAMLFVLLFVPENNDVYYVEDLKNERSDDEENEDE